MKTLVIIWTAAIISGVASFSYINTGINALLVRPTQPASSLPVKAADKNGQDVLSYQVQGGYRQAIQQTAANSKTPQPATASVQGDQEAGDNLQPAMGYGALSYVMQ